MADKKWALTTGSAPGGYESTTYTDIATWSVAEAYDLATPGDSVYLECFDDWATGLGQTASQIRDSHGWVTDTTNYITVKAADGEGHGGLVGGGFFITTSATDGAIVPYGIDYVFEGLEIVASNSYCVNASFANDSTVNDIDKCIFSGFTSRAIRENSAYTLLTNSLIIDGSDRGIDNILTINCTIDNFPNDYAALARNLAWRNVVVTNSYGANDPWYQDGSVDYCATDYSSGVAGSNSVTLTADPYNDRASNDYSISNTSELYDAGVDLTSTYPQLAYDIAGNPRSSTYSIGAYEYVSGAAGVTVTADFVDSTASIFQPTLEAGAATLTADYLNTTAAIYQPDLLAASSDLTADFVDSAASIFQPSLLAGAADLTADFVDSTATIPQPSLVASDATITADYIDSAASIFQPTLGAGAATLVADFVDSTASVYQPVLGGVATLSADFIDSTATISQPNLTGASTVTADFVDSTATIYQPTLGAGAATIVADFVNSTASIFIPSLSGPQTLTAGFVDSTAAIYSPTLADSTAIWTAISEASTTWTEISDTSTTWTEI